MKPIKRFLYLMYYFKKINWSVYHQFLKHAAQLTKLTKFQLAFDSLICVFLYNISLLEYFQFRFFELNARERENWAGTGFMYEYQLYMNPISERIVLDNKTLFYQKYQHFFIHQVLNLNELKNDETIWLKFKNNGSSKIVLKTKDGKCGNGVLIKLFSEFNNQNELIEFMESNNFDLLEEYIVQHHLLNELSPSAVNTVRIFTQLDKNNQISILGCRLRISVNSMVDNMAAGNMAASIDENTGIINGNGVYSDITKNDEEFHPITKIKIKGFQIPFWPEILQMVKEAATLNPQNKSIGWDIVITENGPGILEGNHDWCKLVWQLPVKTGMKSVLLNHLNNSNA